MWLPVYEESVKRSSSVLMGHALEYDIANVVDSQFTVVAKIQKRYLRAD